GRLDRLLIQPERRIERSLDLHFTDRAVGHHDALEQHDALNLRAHRVSCVLRLDVAQQARNLNAVAGTIRPTARAAAVAGPHARSLSRSDTCALARSRAAAAARSLRRG